MGPMLALSDSVLSVRVLSLLEIESLTYSLMGLITGFGMLRRDNSADQKAANEALTHAADRGMTFWGHRGRLRRR